MSYSTAIHIIAARTSHGGYGTRGGAGARAFAPMAHPDNGRSLAIRHIVGAHVLQTPGAIQAEMEQINADILTFGKELSDRVTNDPGFPHSPQTPIEQFFESVWSPWYQSWETWYNKHNGWWGNLWWNHAPEAEQYRDQLIQLRAKAGSLGLSLESPDPAKPPPGLIDSIIKAIWNAVKAMMWVGLGIVALTLMVKWARSK